MEVILYCHFCYRDWSSKILKLLETVGIFFYMLFLLLSFFHIYHIRSLNISSPILKNQYVIIKNNFQSIEKKAVRIIKRIKLFPWYKRLVLSHTVTRISRSDFRLRECSFMVYYRRHYKSYTRQGRHCASLVTIKIRSCGFTCPSPYRKRTELGLSREGDLECRQSDGNVWFGESFYALVFLGWEGRAAIAEMRRGSERESTTAENHSGIINCRDDLITRLNELLAFAVSRARWYFFSSSFGS